MKPKVLQALGMVIVAGAALFWAFTGQQSALIVGAGLSLIGLGAYSGLRIDIKTDRLPPEASAAADPATDATGKSAP